MCRHMHILGSVKLVLLMHSHMRGSRDKIMLKLLKKPQEFSPLRQTNPIQNKLPLPDYVEETPLRPSMTRIFFQCGINRIN